MKKAVLLVLPFLAFSTLQAQYLNFDNNPNFRALTYPAKTEAVVLDSSTLPIVILNTGGPAIEDEFRITVDMGIIDNGPGVYNHVADVYNNYNGKASIEIRGSSSQSFPKKSYSLELQDVAGVEQNVSVMGMPADDDWILYAPYTDKTLLRDALAYHLGELQGYYSPKFRYCEVVLNGSYQGIYLMLEKIKVNDVRVDIDEMTDSDVTGEDVTGGYMIKIDRPDYYLGGTDYFTSDWEPWVDYVYVSPKSESIADAQKDYIKDYIADFENTIYSADAYDLTNGYYKYVDMNSFVDYFIINEMSRNVDAYRLSTYLYKNNDDLGGKLVAGPLWDYNLAFGNADYCSAWGVTNFFTDCGTGASWWNNMYNDPTFDNRLNCRWSELRSDVFNTDSIQNWIDEQVAILGDAVDRNYETWDILGQYVWPNYYIGATYSDEISYLKLWISARLSWMDDNMPGDPGVCDMAGSAPIAITEFNYNSDNYNDSNEWLELHNYGGTAVDISNWVVKDETPFNSYTIPAGTVLDPDEYLVVLSDIDTFFQVYTGITNYVGPFNWGFDNTAGSVKLYDNLGGLVRQIDYLDSLPWPKGADGFGTTLQIIDETGDENDPANWMASCVLGTPGEPYVPCDYPVIVSEINYNSLLAYNPGDWIEIWNRGSSSANIGGWILRDANTSNIYVIPNGTVLAPDGRVVISDSLESFTAKFPTVTNVIGEPAFHFSNGGDAVRLYDPVGKIQYSVRFNDLAPWPTDADGLGFTLETVDPGGNPNLAASWVAGCLYGSPGAAFVVPCPDAIVDYDPVHLTLAPNPFSNSLYITFDKTAEATEIFITNLLGEKVASLNPINNTIMWDGKTSDGNDLATGVYFINLLQQNGNISTARVVKIQ